MRWSVSGRARVYCVLLAAFASTSTAAAATLELVSRVAPGLGSETASGFSATYFDHVSESGRWVLIESSAQDLVAGQTLSLIHI